MNGRIAGAAIVGAALVAGAAIYYLQVYAYYVGVPAESAEVRLVPASGGDSVAVDFAGFDGIDANSSPLRYRACFNLPGFDADAYQPYPAAEPLNAPRWFSCFDAAGIGAALAAGGARAFLSEPEIADGVDRVIAVHSDGRAYAWHQLNEKYRD